MAKRPPVKKSAKKAKKPPVKKKSAGINDAILHLNNQLGGAVLMQRTYMVALFGRFAKEVPSFNPDQFLEHLYFIQSTAPNPQSGGIENAGMSELKKLIELSEEMLQEIRKN